METKKFLQKFDYQSLEQNERGIKKIALQAFFVPTLQREMALAAMYQRGENLQYAPPCFQNDRDVVLVACARYGRALQYAPPEMQNDKSTVMGCILKDGMALEFASPELRNDRLVVKAAAERDDRVLEFASQELLKDFKFMPRTRLLCTAIVWLTTTASHSKEVAHEHH